MAIKSLSSAYVQKNFGTVLDSVLSGTTTIVERYSRPLAVIISHDEYQHFLSLQNALLAESRAIAEKNDSEGTWVSGEEVERKLRQRGILVD